MKLEDAVAQGIPSYGRLTITGPAPPGKRGRRRVRVRCSCNELVVAVSDLKSGNTKSCGCLVRERMTRHGMWKSPEAAAWRQMNHRCPNGNSESYADYGGRGIKVCERWRESFEAFFADMGPRPSAHHSLDRYPNNDGNYEPGNCRWATAKQQAQNRRDNVRLTVDGETLTVAEWSRRSGVPDRTIRGRLTAGWTHEQAIRRMETR